MPNISCMIIDDEPKAVSIIQGYVERVSSLTLKASFCDSLDAVEYLNKNNVDIIFLDIKMPNLTGFELVRTINSPTKVIITTAYSEFAMEGFDLEVVDYLLKPISFTRFLKAVNKYISFHHVEDLDEVMKTESKDFILLKEGKKFHRVYYKDIEYIECMNEYVILYYSNTSLKIKRSMASIEEALPVDLFIRIHRSFIMYIPRITSFTASSLNIADKKFPIGKKFKKTTLDRLSNNFIIKNRTL